MNLSKRKIFILAILSILIALIALAEIDYLEPTPEYINASLIETVGLAANSTSNITLISEINSGYWYGNESTGTPFNVNIYFYNVTKFDFVDSTTRYYSISGTPSTHEVELMIWCETHNEFIELKDYHNENHWYSRQYELVDSSHYIMSNGTVIIQFLHESNGNSNHRLLIDALRLVNIKNEIIH